MGLFLGGFFNVGTWHLDLNGNRALNAGESIATNMQGRPVAGDWTGTGVDRVGTYRTNTIGGIPVNTWSLDVDGTPATPTPTTFQEAGNLTIPVVSPFGARKRPVVEDWDADGEDNIGLFKGEQTGVLPQGGAEWFLDLGPADSGVLAFDGTLQAVVASAGPLLTGPGTGVPGDGRFEPPPTGELGQPVSGLSFVWQDIFYRFGDERAEPIVGNFDPPSAGTGTVSDPAPDPGPDSTSESASIPRTTEDVSNRRRGAYRLSPDEAGSVVLTSDVYEQGDRDWYLIRAPRSGRMGIHVSTPHSDLDPVFAVFKGREVMARNNNYNGSRDSYASFKVRAGQRYFVIVRGVRGATGEYNLWANYLTRPAADDHANRPGPNATGLTQTIVDGRTSWSGKGAIERPSDKDFFQFTAEADGSYLLSASTLTGELDTVLSVYDSLGRLIARNDNSDGGTDSRLQLDLVAGELYYLGLKGNAGLLGDYELAVDRLLEQEL